MMALKGCGPRGWSAVKEKRESAMLSNSCDADDAHDLNDAKLLRRSCSQIGF
jgi:hypothetical protein